MKAHLLITIFINALIFISCSDKRKTNNADANEWEPHLSEGYELMRIVKLSPAEVLPINGMIE